MRKAREWVARVAAKSRRSATRAASDSWASEVIYLTVRQFSDPILEAPWNASARLSGMATASRRTRISVWVIVLALFAGAAWFAFNTIRASVQPLGVLADPFPEEESRPEGS